MDHSAPLSTSTILLDIAIVLVLVLANAFFVASEFALVSVRKTRIDQLAAEGSSAAAVVQRAVRDLDRYIAATQVGITLASLLLGGLGERALEPLLAPLFGGMPKEWMGITRASLAASLAYFIMTALHVIIGELMPKSIALQKAEMTALWIGRPMTLFAFLFSPLIWLLNGIGNFLLRRIGFHAAEGHSQVHSPEELDMLFTESHRGGEINATEFEILHRVMRFSETTARSIMVPRVEMQAIPVDTTRSALTEFLQGRPHTRIPVYQGSLDDIVGMVNSKDLEHFNYGELAKELEQLKLEQLQLEQLQTVGPSDWNKNGGQHVADDSRRPGPQTLNLTSLVHEVARVPETTTIDKLLTEFKQRRQQIAIVIDEFGGTAGLVTLGDLLEQVFGDVPDEGDPTEPDILQRPDGRVQLAGRVRIDEVNERFGVGFRSDEADTIAGLVLSALGRAAAVGDEVEMHGAALRVEKVDRLRIVTVSLLLPDGNASENLPAV